MDLCRPKASAVFPPAVNELPFALNLISRKQPEEAVAAEAAALFGKPQYAKTGENSGKMIETKTINAKFI